MPGTTERRRAFARASAPFAAERQFQGAQASAVGDVGLLE
jgi:hypothetical protein